MKSNNVMNENNKVKCSDRTIKEIRKYNFDSMYVYEKRMWKKDKMKLILFTSGIVLLIISVITGKFDDWMNDLLNMLVLKFKG